MLGSKKEVESEQLSQKPLPQKSSAKSLPKKSHEAPAAIGSKSSIPEYAVVDKSKKKKKRSSLMVYSSHIWHVMYKWILYPIPFP